MGYRTEEFDMAFAKVSEKYPFVRRSVAEQVLGHFERLKNANDRAKQKDKKPYWLLMREALNESNIMGELERKPYKSMISHIHGKHGNYTQQQYRNNQASRPIHPRFPQDTPNVEVETKPDGQMRWKL